MTRQSTTSPLARILALAVPVSLQALVTSSLSFVDIYMVSSLGDGQVAAVGLINKVYFMFMVGLFGLTSGVSILVAQYWGADRKTDVHALLYAACFWVSLITIPLTLLALFGSNNIADLLTPDIAIAQYTAEYWLWTSPFIALTGFSLVLATVQRATNDSFWPMVASIVALISNTLLNYLVLFGPFEALNLGLRGVAIATNFSRLLEVLLLAVVLIRHLRPHWIWQKKAFIQIWHQGKVLTVQETSWSMGIFAFFLVYSYMGPQELAAMSLLSPIESIFIDIFIGFGIAASILLGQHLGRSEFEQAWQLARYILTRFTTAALIIALGFLFCGAWVVELFTSISPEIRQLMLGVWIIYCIAIPIKTFNMIAVIGVLRAGGDNKFVLITEFISIWLLSLPLLAFCALVLKLPLWAAVGITVLEEAGKVLFFLYRIKTKNWLKNLTIR